MKIEYVLLAVSQLPPKERRLINLRWGLLDGIRRTLEDTGRDFGLTRERIRQIEAKALEMIRGYAEENYKKNN